MSTVSYMEEWVEGASVRVMVSVRCVRRREKRRSGQKQSVVQWCSGAVVQWYSGAVPGCLLPRSCPTLNHSQSVRSFTSGHSFIFSHPFTTIHPIRLSTKHTHTSNTFNAFNTYAHIQPSIKHTHTVPISYKWYCGPCGACDEMKPEDGEHCCDPFSNSNAQSIYKLAPSKEWAHWGFPANATDGFVGDPKLHELNVGDTKYPLPPVP